MITLAAGVATASHAEEAGPRYKLSARQLSADLAARFPVRLGIPGLAELVLRSPELLLRPNRNRAGASLLAEASGSALGPLPPGRLDLLFALRYQAQDRTLRAVQPELARLDVPGLAPQAQRDLQDLVMPWVQTLDAALVLHRFSAQELGLTDAMGFTPAGLRVEEDGVALEFQPKRDLWGAGPPQAGEGQ